MKNYIKYSILITLAFLMTFSLVKAAPPIGTTTQPMPYESNPGNTGFFMVGGPLSSGTGAMKDGDLTSSGTFTLGAPHIIRPNLDGFYTAWSEFPAGLGFFAWKDETPDGDSSYVFTTTAAARESSQLDDPPADASGTITSVTVWVVAKRATAVTTTITPFLRLGVTDLSGTSISLTTSTYTAFSRVIGRPGGGAWSWADITSLQAGVLFGAGTPRVTQLYVEVAGPTTGYFEFNTFTNTPLFSIGWVDIRMKYSTPGTTDDTYTIEYTTGANPFVTLQPATTNVFDQAGPGAPAVQVWSQLAEPTDGTWDWTDIGSLRVRITVNQVGAWDVKTMTVFEVWATAYQPPTPPVSSTTMSIQPPVVSAATGMDLFVDVYVNNVADLFGYQFKLNYDTAVLTATEAFTYYPWTSFSDLTIDDASGFVTMAFSMATVPVGSAFYGNSPVARIYFMVDASPPSTLLDISDNPFDTILADSTGTRISFTIHDGLFTKSRFMSLQPPAMLPPGDPTGTQWHELYPQYSYIWRLTSWIDNGDGDLTASDQIDMLNETGWTYWFHVDTVTTTIHWTFKAPDVGIGAAESTGAFDPSSPLGSTWHQVYPVFSRTFTILSWTDNGNGVFDQSDQFDWEYDDNPGVPVNAHLDAISTDIILSQKGDPEPPSVPEFPLGLGIIMALAPMIPIVYIWRLRKNKPKLLTTQTNPKGLKP